MATTLRAVTMSERKAARILTHTPIRHQRKAWRLFLACDVDGLNRSSPPVRRCFMAFSVMACMDVDRALSLSAR